MRLGNGTGCSRPSRAHWRTVSSLMRKAVATSGTVISSGSCPIDSKLAWDVMLCQGQHDVRFLVLGCIAWHAVRMTTTPAAPARTGWTVDDSTFGARLALVRQRMDWNVKEAARECGVPGASWRTWERDGVQPRDKDEIAWRIAERTGCDYGWLLAGPRLTTYASDRGGARPEANSRYPRPTDRTRPNGHPKRTAPDPTTRRPVRLGAALAAI